MRRTLLAAALGLLLWPHSAFAEEQIRSIDVSLTVDRRGDLRVEETIVYDFGEADDRHGITRGIPRDFARDGIHHRFRITGLAIHDADGAEVPFDDEDQSDTLFLRIGDPDATVQGVRTYVLTYVVQGVTLIQQPGSTGDELVWNAIGTDHSVPIRSARVHASVEGVQSAQFETTCSAGSAGTINTASCVVVPASDTVLAAAPVASLEPYEGVTLALRWPSGILDGPPWWRIVGAWLLRNWGYGLLAATLALLLRRYILRGRDPESRATIIPEYDVPDALRPVEVGAIVDEIVHDRDLTATLVDFARRGILTVTPIRKREGKKPHDFELTDTGRRDTLRPYEGELLAQLFPGDQKTTRVSNQRAPLARAWEGVRTAVYDALTKDGYFKEDPSLVRWVAYGWAFAFVFAGFFSIGFVDTNYGSSATTLSIFASSALCLLFARALPSRTEKGVRAREHILGLKRYLTIAERARLRAAEAEHQFETLLPVALVLGVAAAWSQRFAGILQAPPSWMHDTATTFDPDLFPRLVTRMGSVATRSLAAPPSKSSGGWRSGGGGWSSGGGISVGSGGGGGSIGSW